MPIKSPITVIDTTCHLVRDVARLLRLGRYAHYQHIVRIPPSAR